MLKLIVIHRRYESAGIIISCNLANPACFLSVTVYLQALSAPKVTGQFPL